jgi:hypothetical protein
MKKCLPICILILLLGFSTASAPGQNKRHDRDRFVGAWKLLALERPGTDGQLSRIECCGMFVFTRDGHLSVQVMDRGLNAQAASAGADQYSQGDYEASYGSYVVDETNHTFNFHVDGALVSTLIGKDLPRRYTFNGDQMIVESTRSDEHWRVIWGRY